MATAVGLVVDDDDQIRRLFVEALRRGGIEARAARSAREALKLAQVLTPSFVVTDIEMPTVDGVELCRRLRELPGTAKVPIVVVTGSGSKQRDDATAAGCDVVLPKPCSPALLLETIRRLLEKSSGAAPTP